MRGTIHERLQRVASDLHMNPATLQGLSFEEEVTQLLEGVVSRLDATGERAEAIEDRLDQLILDEKKE